MVLVILAEGGLAFDFPLATYGDRFVPAPLKRFPSSTTCTQIFKSLAILVRSCACIAYCFVCSVETLSQHVEQHIGVPKQRQIFLSESGEKLSVARSAFSQHKISDDDTVFLFDTESTQRPVHPVPVGDDDGKCTLANFTILCASLFHTGIPVSEYVFVFSSRDSLATAKRQLFPSAPQLK